jgi:Na+/phosphate symporter
MNFEFRQSHIERLNRGDCGLLPGLVFMDMMANIEKIGDHLTNVAEAVLGNLRWNEERLAESQIIDETADTVS